METPTRATLASYLATPESVQPHLMVYYLPPRFPKTSQPISIYYGEPGDRDLYGVDDLRKLVVCTPSLRMTLTGRPAGMVLSLRPDPSLHNEVAVERWVQFLQSMDMSVMRTIRDRRESWGVRTGPHYQVTVGQEEVESMTLLLPEGAEECLGVYNQAGAPTALGELGNGVVRVVVELTSLAYDRQTNCFRSVWRPLQIRALPDLSPLYIGFRDVLVIGPAVESRPAAAVTRPYLPPPRPPVEREPARDPPPPPPPPVRVQPGFEVKPEQLAEAISRLRPPRVAEEAEPTDKKSKRSRRHRHRPRVV